MEDELVGILGKLIDFVENASPVIWEAAQRQVVANIASGALWAIVWVVVLYGSFRLGGFLWTKGKEADLLDEDFIYAGSICAYACSVAFGFVALHLGISVVKMAINPAYYAIENILSMVR